MDNSLQLFGCPPIQFSEINISSLLSEVIGMRIASRSKLRATLYELVNHKIAIIVATDVSHEFFSIVCKENAIFYNIIHESSKLHFVFVRL